MFSQDSVFGAIEAWRDGESFILYQPLLHSSFVSGLYDFNSILIQKMIMGEDNDDKDEAHPLWFHSSSSLQSYPLTSNLNSSYLGDFTAHALKSPTLYEFNCSFLCSCMLAPKCSWNNLRVSEHPYKISSHHLWAGFTSVWQFTCWFSQLSLILWFYCSETLNSSPTPCPHSTVFPHTLQKLLPFLHQGNGEVLNRNSLDVQHQNLSIYESTCFCMAPFFSLTSAGPWRCLSQISPLLCHPLFTDSFPY